MKSCIAVLTRGYDDISKYCMLIKRNNHIAKNLDNKSTDILIFHEGDIQEKHQGYIQNETPGLKIQFIDISPIAFRNEKKNISVKTGVRGFSLGYRHMCSFWFVNFWDAVKEYDKLLRIDEDCYIDFNIDKILSDLDNWVFIVGGAGKDDDDVTMGLNKFSIDFINQHKNTFTFKQHDTKLPTGPYTHTMGLALDKIRNTDIFQKYKTAIDASNMIYERRWGDLPLWGEVIYYIFGSDTLNVDKNIKYFHQSHNGSVN
jgi:hypothetical protein